MDRKPFARLMRFAAPHKGSFIFAILCSVIAVIGGILPYYFSARVITALIAGKRDIMFYAVCCGAGAASFVAKAVFSSLSTSASHKATFRVLSEVRRTVCAKFARVPLGFVLESPSGQLKETVVERVEQLEVPLAHAVPEISSNLFVPLCILVYLFTLDFRMGLSVVFVFAIAMLCYLLMMRSYPKHYGEVMQTGKKMSAATVEYIGGIKVIKTFNQTDGSYMKFSESVKRNTNAVLNWMRSTQGYSAVMMTLITSVLIGVLPTGAICYSLQSISTQVLIVSILLSLGIVEPLASAVFLTDDIAKISTVMSELSTVFDAQEMQRPTTPVTLFRYDIELDHVCFGYGEREILHDISLTAEEGKTTAFVGSSGSGKSTIAKLIASLWDTHSGSVRIGETDVKDIPFEQLSDIISYVAQDNYLFNDTIRNNIRMGRHDATDAEVEAVAKKTGCHDFISSLPDGYETVCGSGGKNLSGGECQRITIARAMMKNTPIVILDEATSYTDPENEAVIQKAINVLTAEKTLIVIAHRLSTITSADKIVLVDNGRIEDTGTHSELLNHSAHYCSMWQAHVGLKEDSRDD